jgi:hypothetical protein
MLFEENPWNRDVICQIDSTLLNAYDTCCNALFGAVGHDTNDIPRFAGCHTQDAT